MRTPANYAPAVTHFRRWLLAGSVLLGVIGLRAQSDWTPLWNGTDLDGWTTWMRPPDPSSEVPGLKRDVDGKYTEPIGSDRDPLKVFAVELQFKWGEKKWPPRDRTETPRDSGLLYHVHAAPGAAGRTWARSIELQIQEHDVGDLYAIGSAIAVRAKARAGTKPTVYDYDPMGEWTFFSQSQGAPGRCIKQPDNERPTGEWNSVELVAFGEDAIHIVNGKVVMRLHGPVRIDGDVPAPITSGPIILQSEGAEVFYRDIQIRPIAAIPAEWRDSR
jgi:hypothetical protein